MKKIVLNKKNLTVKGIMAVALIVIMAALIIGYFATKNIKPEKNKSLTYVDTSESTTQELTEAETESITDENGKTVEVPETEPVTAEPTTARSKALIAGITDENNWPVAIIGINYPLPDEYTPKLSPALTSSGIELDFRICQYYQQMYEAAKQAGCILTPYSGYHSYSLQESTYNRKVSFYTGQGLSKEEAEAQANKKILPAGCSEHNAGLAIDIVSASSDFENTKEYQWLVDNAHNYGFILRYPADKETITGVDFQPWHWRFVGVENAKKMKQSNECLEEFLGIV